MLVMQCCSGLDAEHIPEYGGMLSVELSILRIPEYHLVSFRCGLVASLLPGSLDWGTPGNPLMNDGWRPGGSWFLVIPWNSNPMMGMWIYLVDDYQGFEGWHGVLNHDSSTGANFLFDFLVRGRRGESRWHAFSSLLVVDYDLYRGGVSLPSCYGWCR